MLILTSIVSFAYWFCVGFFGFYAVMILLCFIIAACISLMNRLEWEYDNYQKGRSTAKRRLQFEKIICPVTLEIYTPGT